MTVTGCLDFTLSICWCGSGGAAMFSAMFWLDLSSYYVVFSFVRIILAARPRFQQVVNTDWHLNVTGFLGRYQATGKPRQHTSVPTPWISQSLALFLFSTICSFLMFVYRWCPWSLVVLSGRNKEKYKWRNTKYFLLIIMKS
jgi:hypothetical protein